MRVKFKRIPENHDLPLPTYASTGASGMDVRAYCPEGAVTLEPGKVELISIGFSVELPENTEMQIRSRSGLSTREQIIIPNGIGTVDSDYRGVVKVPLLALKTPYRVHHGDRIAQAVIVPVLRPDICEVEALSESERGTGGFGSTGFQ